MAGAARRVDALALHHDGQRSALGRGDDKYGARARLPAFRQPKGIEDVILEDLISVGRRDSLSALRQMIPTNKDWRHWSAIDRATYVAQLCVPVALVVTSIFAWL